MGENGGGSNDPRRLCYWWPQLLSLPFPSPNEKTPTARSPACNCQILYIGTPYSIIASMMGGLLQHHFNSTAILNANPIKGLYWVSALSHLYRTSQMAITRNSWTSSIWIPSPNRRPKLHDTGFLSDLSFSGFHTCPHALPCRYS